MLMVVVQATWIVRLHNSGKLVFNFPEKYLIGI